MGLVGLFVALFLLTGALAVDPLHQWLLDEGHSKNIGKDTGRERIDTTLKTGAIFTGNGGGVRLRGEAYLDLATRADGMNVKFDYKPTPNRGFSLTMWYVVKLCPPSPPSYSRPIHF